MTLDDLVILSQGRQWSRDGTARRIRLAAGLSQPELASACGANHSSVSSWETGRRIPRRAAGLAYAKLLTVLARTTRVGDAS